jgi:hypothetical protein
MPGAATAMAELRTYLLAEAAAYTTKQQEVDAVRKKVGESFQNFKAMCDRHHHHHTQPPKQQKKKKENTSAATATTPSFPRTTSSVTGIQSPSTPWHASRASPPSIQAPVKNSTIQQNFIDSRFCI